jgi:hypothetical protein
MYLAIVDDEGVVHTVTNALEAYDLDKPLAAASVVQDIIQTIEDGDLTNKGDADDV